MSEDYTYLAKLPAGAEGKVQVAYNYVVEFSQRYNFTIKVTNLTNRPLEKLYYDEFLKDGSNVITETRNNEESAPVYGFPLQPGDSTIIGGGRTSVLPGFGGLTSFETWTVEIEVTYLKFS